MRGRDRVEKTRRPGTADADNPLARRFHPDDEPDTIDLTPGEGFPGATGSLVDEPTTRDLSKNAPEAVEAISFVPDTGKFYLNPGDASTPVRLNDQPVSTRTELRQGDRIQIANTLIEIKTL